jgi:predicted CoA-substrate-specific enzyme activase
LITVGCDIGSVTAKAVILKDNEILSYSVKQASPFPEESAALIIEDVLGKSNLKMDDINYCIGTGYGRKNIFFVNEVESEIACHGKGALWQLPTVRTVIDIGGQDAKAIKINETGMVERYVYNDKCASGTGRFLEIIADSLDLELDTLGDISMNSKEELTLSNQCVVFAETEIISLVSDGKEIPDIINALHRAVANRAASLAKSIVLENDVVMTGGVARNSGMFHALEKALGVKLFSVREPQINGAIGAALIAAERAIL